MESVDAIVSRSSDEHGDNYLVLLGVVDLFAATRLRELAVECIASGRRTVVDCGQLERIDGSALQLLLATEREARASGVALALRGVNDSVARYLRLAGAEALLALTSGGDAAASVPVADPVRDITKD